MNELFESTVRYLSREHDVPVATVEFSRKTSTFATSRAGGQIIYGPDLDGQSPEFVRWVAAHELAHVTLGHGTARAHQHTIVMAVFGVLVVAGQEVDVAAA